MKSQLLRQISIAFLALGFLAAGWATRHFTASGSKPVLAIVQAFMAMANGQAWLMSSQFDMELKIDLDSGLYKLSAQGAKLRMTFAQPGLANSFANQYHDANMPCVIEMAIDGRGYPSMELSTFRSFNGKITDSDPDITPSRSLSTAFTIAHELGHCMLYAQAAALPLELVQKRASEVLDHRLALSEDASKKIFHLFHESHADAIALIAMSRRMNASDFDAMARLLLTRRKASYLEQSSETHHDSHATFRIIVLAQEMGWNTISKLDGDGARKTALSWASHGTVASIIDRPITFGMNAKNPTKP